MNSQLSLSRLRLLSNDDLEKELASPDHDEAARHAILAEAIRRLSHARARPHWIQWVTLGVALLAAVFSAIATIPVLADLDRGVWFDF